MLIHDDRSIRQSSQFCNVARSWTISWSGRLRFLHKARCSTRLLRRQVHVPFLRPYWLISFLCSKTLAAPSCEALYRERALYLTLPRCTCIHTQRTISLILSEGIAP